MPYAARACPSCSNSTMWRPTSQQVCTMSTARSARWRPCRIRPRSASSNPDSWGARARHRYHRFTHYKLRTCVAPVWLPERRRCFQPAPCGGIRRVLPRLRPSKSPRADDHRGDEPTTLRICNRTVRDSTWPVSYSASRSRQHSCLMMPRLRGNLPAFSWAASSGAGRRGVQEG